VAAPAVAVVDDNVIVVAAAVLLLLLANRALGIIKDGSIPMTLLLRMIGFSSEPESSGDDEEESAFSTISIGRARLRDTFDGDILRNDFFFDINALLACIVYYYTTVVNARRTHATTGKSSGSPCAQT